MAQLEEQLNQILGDPQAMEQIMALAQSLSGKGQEHGDPSPEQDSPQPEAENASPLSALSGLDPRLLQLGMGLLSEYSAQDDRKTALLEALKPFLKRERQEKIDQAVRIARLSRVVRAAFWLLGGTGEEEAHV